MMVKDGKHKLVGFVDLGEMQNAFEKMAGEPIDVIQVTCYSFTVDFVMTQTLLSV